MNFILSLKFHKIFSLLQNITVYYHFLLLVYHMQFMSYSHQFDYLTLKAFLYCSIYLLFMLNTQQIPFRWILESVPHPIVFIDCEHIIRYMNKYAYQRYSADILGTSIFDCHRERHSHLIIEKSFKQLQEGANIVHMYTGENKEGFMVAVRDEEGKLLGYWEIIFQKEFNKDSFLSLFGGNYGG